MGIFQDSLAAARRQRLRRMESASTVSQAGPDAAPAATRKEIEAILRRLDALETRIGAPAQDLSKSPPVGDSSLRSAISDIKAAVCRDYGITPRDLVGESRSRPIVQARQVGLYLARHLTAHSLQEIGRLFGHRDHTTALYAHQKIKRLRAEDRDLDRRIATLEAGLMPGPASVTHARGAQPRKIHNDP